MKNVIILCVIYFTTVWHDSAVAGAFPLFLRPFAPAVALLVIAHYTREVAPLLWAALLGLVLDGLGDGRLGVQMVLAVALVWCLEAIRRHDCSVTAVSLTLQAFVLAWVWRLTCVLIASVSRIHQVDFVSVLSTAAVEAVATAVFSGVMWVILMSLLGQERFREDVAANHSLI